jgi:hypothetical protein
MHPRHTRSRPLILLNPKGYYLFVNNINSPGYLRPSLFNAGQTSYWTDAVTCQCIHGVKAVKANKFLLQCFIVEFWDGKSKQSRPVASVQVHAPAHWSADLFLEVFVNDLIKHNVISLNNFYYVSGEAYPFNAINTIHHRFNRL